MNKQLLPEVFYCIKLRTGETLFVEVLDFDKDAMTVYCPMQVISEIKGATDNIMLIPWMPYTVRGAFPIPMNMIFFADELNKTFVEYYGRTVIQYEINKIKQKVSEEMETRDDFLTMSDGLDEMKKVSKELTLKFGVEGPDFSDFESVLEKYKENLVVH